MTKEQKKKLAERLCGEIDASIAARGSLPDRWKKTRALYNNEKGQSTLNIIEGVEPYPMPIYRAKADRIKDAVIKTFTSVYPYVQVIEEGETSSNSEVYEKTLMCLAEYSDFKRTFGRAFVECMNTDLGIMRLVPTFDKSGQLTGLKSERIKPEMMVGFPTYKSRFEECDTVGHKFPQSVKQIKQKQKNGEYEKCEVVATSAQDFLDANVSYQKTSVDQTTYTDDDSNQQPVICYELITDEKVDGEWKKLLVTVAYDTRELLKVQDYPYPLHWYIEMRIDDEDDTLWPNNSLGQRVQGLNQIFSDGNATMFLGSMANAFPVICVKGGSLGKSKFSKWTPGMLMELPNGVEMEVLGTAFNPGAMPMGLAKVEEMIDAVMGINRIGTGQALPADTREAAINGLLQAQQDAKEGYADAVSPSVKKYFQLLDLFFVTHFWDFKRIYGPRIPIQDPEQVPTAYRLEVTGQNTGSSPSANQQKLGNLYTMAQNPMSTLSLRKVETRIAQTMDLPFDTSTLGKDEIDAIIQMMAQLEQEGLPMEQTAQVVMQSLQQFVTGIQAQNAANEATRDELAQQERSQNSPSGPTA